MPSRPEHPAHLSAPIGIFDSGVGGLSVLRELLRLLPHERMVYLADTAFAPYGERSQAEIEARSLHVVRHLVDAHRIKALVVACNTATAQAVQALRAAFDPLPIVGIEPALKPAVALTQTGAIGIMATHATVHSARFARLLHDWSGACRVRVQACNGLALAIENALDLHANPDGQTVHSLCRRYVDALRPFVDADPACGIDTLVLGCTHYPFAADALRALLPAGLRLIEPGEPVARQSLRLLQQHRLLAQAAPDAPPAALTLLASASPLRLQGAAQQWLGRSETAHAVALD